MHSVPPISSTNCKSKPVTRPRRGPPETAPFHHQPQGESTMTHTIEIPLCNLIPSTANVRHRVPVEGVEGLAASIAAHGLLQNLTVKLAPPDKQKKKGPVYEVVAGRRRHAALKFLAKSQRLDKAAPIPCHPIEDALAEEISLVENALQCPMHPADQYEAFAKLHTQHGMNAEDIAARF